MALKRKLRFVHPHTGEVYERTTEADYTHISFKNGEPRWHMSADAAYKRGKAWPLTSAHIEGNPDFNDRRPKDGPGGGTCTVVSGATGQLCGKAAVTSFKGRDGKTHRECAEHNYGARNG